MRKKGTFTNLRLSVAQNYDMPPSRRRMFYLGTMVAVFFLGYTFFNSNFQKSSFISNGPLSSNHANFENDCSACHTEFASVTNQNCSVCHEKYGDHLGVYTFSAHYIYRSDDFRRLVPSENEKPCFACHIEHRGRDTAITDIPDSQCLVCHQYGSFNEKHPQFEFVAEQIPDDSNLNFKHIHHVEQVQKRENLLDIERSCLYCHNPEPIGRNFQPINFERHCDACHLTTSTATPWLRTRGSPNSKTPGVEALETIRQRKRPGNLWAFYTNVNEFQKRGDRVRKSPVYHRDPWIMENLKLVRRQLYPNLGLSDLLEVSGQVPSEDSRIFYHEAIQTLDRYAFELRGHPEKNVQQELAQINLHLRKVEKTILNPYASLDDSKFLLGEINENPELSQGQVHEFKDFVSKLTEPCLGCHRVSNASISRVQKDQRVLNRAKFNHRDHIIQRRCLECHSQIPILENVGNSQNVEDSTDRAAIQNIPSNETCKQCHQSELTSNRCITCHDFHPNKSQRSNLLLYLD